MTPPASPRKPTAGERLRLRQASSASDGQLHTTVSRRLVESMLRAGWVYGEDPDGFRLIDADTLGPSGVAYWKITCSGRWAALTRAQRRTLLALADEDGDGGGQVRDVGLTTAAVQVLVRYGLAADNAPHRPVRRTPLGTRVVTACAAGPDA
ncbi:hypothetical protein [Streptomyces europaeiscabiei]|uniref:hypothetical protein n=1 Tax=Streptomyces europaeiscabiei TaxID=146819 RepID=UPI0038F6949E